MIITLCGSGRFEDLYHEWNKRLSLSGHVVFGLSTYASVERGNKDWHGNDERKTMVDLVHLAKIEQSHAIVVLSKERYIGESTHREILWAQVRDKSVYYIEPLRSDQDAHQLLR